MPSSPLSSHLQACIVYLAVTDREFLRLVRGVLRPDHLGTRPARDLLQIAYDFWDAHREVPGSHLQDELSHRLAKMRPEDVELTIAYVERIRDLDPPNPDYVVARVNTFVKAAEIRDAIIRASSMLEGDGNLSEIENLLTSALKVGVTTEDVGIYHLTDPDELASDEPEHLTVTGVRGIDRALGGLDRGQLAVIMGGEKGMKSWALQWFALSALLRGLTVAYVSHENSVRIVRKRFDMMFGALWDPRNPDSPPMLEIPYLSEDGAILREGLERPSVYDKEARLAARAVVSKFGGKLIIKKFPMGQCSIYDLEAYINQLELAEGVVPDVLVNDYPDVMQPHTQDRDRHWLNEVYIRHKGWADEKGMLVVVATQVQRGTEFHPRLRTDHAAEDIRKMANADAVFGITVPPTKFGEGRANFGIVVTRDGPSNVWREIQTYLPIGQFCLFDRPLGIDRDDGPQLSA